MHPSIYAAFADEFEKIAKTFIMKALSPAAKKAMQRMTGFTGRAETAAPASARRLRHALTGKGAPQLMTEMHGVKGLSAAERAAKQQSKQHFDTVLKQQGKVYTGGKNLERDIKNIGGHPPALTRTGTRVGPAADKTISGTLKPPPAVMGTRPTVIRPKGQSTISQLPAPARLKTHPRLAYEPTQLAPLGGK